MGYNKENYKRIRAEYETKAFRAQGEADARREELYAAIPSLRALDAELSSFGLRIMKTALGNGDTDADIARLRKENERICAERAALLRANGFSADYSDVKYECEKCHDSGYVGIKMCSCMRRRLVEAGMSSSGLAGLMEKQSFENFDLNYYKDDPAVFAVMSNIFKNIKSYAESFQLSPDAPAPASLLFMGGTGLGKTHLSTALAKTVIERGYDVFYNTAVGMISDFEFKRFGNSVAQSEVDNTARYTECDLLIIDDLGTEMINQFTVSCLYHVINTRLNLQKPTIISTNFDAAELQNKYSDRITSRLFGEYTPCRFRGTDVRRQKLKK